jgi:hypothetical protein
MVSGETKLKLQEDSQQICANCRSLFGYAILKLLLEKMYENVVFCMNSPLRIRLRLLIEALYW